MRDLSNYRKNYSRDKLSEKCIPKQPFDLFNIWFEESNEDSENHEINTMILNTIGKDGFPKGRVVLLKYFSNKGFTFFTNYKSEKGVSIRDNNKVSLTFFWERQERQVIIKGIAEKTEESINDEYFQSRPFGSKVAVHVSENQSSILSNRELIEEKFNYLSLQLQNKEIERPNYWGGYIVKPVEYEFWQGRENRLHDRIRYSLDNSKWDISRLSP
jgi:pyridoxamine 5'-phosphate oxidase